MGLVIYELLTAGGFAFDYAIKRFDKRAPKLEDIDVEQIVYDDEKFDFTEDAVDLIKKLLIHDPLQRLGWYTKMDYDKVLAEEKIDYVPFNLAAVDPDQAELAYPLPPPEIRDHPFFQNIDWIALSEGDVESPLDLDRLDLPDLDPNEEAHYKNHLQVLDEFAKKDPNALIAAALA